MEENVITYTCEKYGINYNDKKAREAFDRNVINKVAFILRTTSNEKEIAQLLEQRIEDSSYLKMAQSLPIEIAQLANKIGDMRNNINHFGYNEDKFTFQKLHNNLEKYYKEFEEIKKEYAEIEFKY